MKSVQQGLGAFCDRVLENASIYDWQEKSI